MRNLKKLLAVVVAFCVLATMSLSAFAAETTAPSISADAQICKDLGVLKGDTAAGVDATYLAKGTTRLQAAQLYLRLIGKEADALAFTGTDNFADSTGIWAGGKAVMAYLKANPDLGWQGIGNNKFDPQGAATAQMIYKVALEALGYKTGTDFQYADTITFGAGKGLSKIADVATLTNDSTASALVEVLKATLKDGSKTLAADLVAKGVITQAAAEAAGVVAGAAIVSVKDIDNTTIAVNYDKAVAAVAADYTVKDSAGAAVAVSAAVAKNGGKTVVLTVATMTAGSSYKVTVGGTEYAIVAKPKDETKPTLASAASVTGTMVRAIFATDDIDSDTLVASNFSIDNSLTISSVALDTTEMAKSANAGKTILLINTSAMTAGKVYTLKSNGVKDLKGNVADADTSKAVYAGLAADTGAPGISTAVSKDGYKVEVTFDEKSKLDEATALNIANYSIDNSLTISKAEMKKNDLGANAVVTLYTSDQTAGKVYTLTVSGIKDALGNAMTASKTAVFAGIAKPTKQTLSGAVGVSGGKKVKVTFGYDCNDTALTVANYSIDKSLTVSGAEFDKDADGNVIKNVVVLTTSQQTAGTVYTVTVKAAVQNVLAQPMEGDKTAVFAGLAADTTKPGLDSVNVVDKNTVELTFTEDVDSTSATNLLNYSMDKGLGYPTSVTMKSGSTNTVVLKTLDQTAGTGYTITVNNVKDKADPANTIDANKTIMFAGKGDSVTTIKLSSAVALNKSQIKVTFNQDVANAGAIEETNYVLTSSDSTETFASSDFTATAPATKGNYAVLTLTSKTLKVASVYTLTLADGSGTDLAGYVTTKGIASGDDIKATFGGSDATKDNFEISGVVAVDDTNLKIMFPNELTAVSATPGNLTFFKTSDLSGSPAATATAITLDSDKKVVKVKVTPVLDSNTVYYVKIADNASYTDTVASLTLKAATNSSTPYATFATGALDKNADVSLKVDHAVMMDKNTLDVYFNKDVTLTLGNITKVTDVNITTDGTASAGVTVTKLAKTPDVKNGLRLYFTGTLTGNSNGVYTVSFPGSGADDGIVSVDNTGKNFSTASGDSRKTTFANNGADNAKPTIISVAPVADNKVKVTFSEPVFKANTEVTGASSTLASTDFVLYNKTTATTIATGDYSIDDENTGSPDSKNFIVDVTGGNFIAGIQYQIAVANGVTVYGEDGISANAMETDTSGTTDVEHSFTFGGYAAAVAVPTATLTNSTTITFNVVPTTNDIYYLVSAAKATSAQVLAGTKVANAATIADTAVTDGQHISMVAVDKAGNVSAVTDYVVTEATPGTVTAVTLQ